MLHPRTAIAGAGKSLITSSSTPSLRIICLTTTERRRDSFRLSAALYFPVFFFFLPPPQAAEKEEEEEEEHLEKLVCRVGVACRASCPVSAPCSRKKTSSAIKSRMSSSSQLLIRWTINFKNFDFSPPQSPARVPTFGKQRRMLIVNRAKVMPHVKVTRGIRAYLSLLLRTRRQQQQLPTI